MTVQELARKDLLKLQKAIVIQRLGKKYAKFAGVHGGIPCIKTAKYLVRFVEEGLCVYCNKCYKQLIPYQRGITHSTCTILRVLAFDAFPALGGDTHECNQEDK